MGGIFFSDKGKKRRRRGELEVHYQWREWGNLGKVESRISKLHEKEVKDENFCLAPAGLSIPLTLVIQENSPGRDLY